MWTVLFGDDESAVNDAQDPVKKSLSPQQSTPPEKLSPFKPLPSTPQPKRASAVVDAKLSNSGKDTDDSAMGMLLKRLNNLMIKVGEHEFEKRTLVDQMEKERKSLSSKISDLEEQMEDLKDQNVQLQYKIEYTSEPMLVERVQDVTDMRDALAAVKKQLEAELQEKDTELKTLKASVASKNKELNELRDEYEKQVRHLIAEREEAKEDAALASQVASEIAREQCEELRKENMTSLDNVAKEKELIEASLVEMKQALLKSEAAAAKVQQNLDAIQTQGNVDAIAIEQLHNELGQVIQKHEQKIMQLNTEEQHKRETLEKRIHEQEAIAAEKAQELENYKHDCVELWNANEELKQQIALTSTQTMAQETKLHEHALSNQSLLENKVRELEKQLEELQERLNQKCEELVEFQSEVGSHVVVDDVTPGDKFVVTSSDNDAISVLTEQVASAQRELTEAMELNLHLNNRNAWLEEQYMMLSSVQSEGDEEHEDEGVAKVSPEKRIIVLEQQLQEAHRAVNEKAEHVSNLEQNHSALSTEFDRLHSSHNELIKSKQSDNATLDALRSELESLRALEAHAAEKDLALHAMEKELSELRSSSKTLDHDVKRLCDVEFQLKQAHETLATAQFDQTEAEANIANLQQEIFEMRKASADTLKSNEHLAVIQSELIQARSDKDAIKIQLSQSQALVQEMQSKIQELEEILNSQLKDRKSFEQQLQNLQEMTQENMEASYELQSNLESTMEDLEKSQAQLRSEQEKCASLKQSFEELKQSSISRADFDRAQSEIAQLEQQIRHLCDQEQSLNHQLQELAHSNTAIVAELQIAVSERAAAEEELKKLKKAFQQELASSQSSYRELQCSHDDLSQSLEQISKKATQAEQQLSAMREQQSETYTKVETLTKKNLSLVAELRNMRDERDKQRQEVQNQLEQLKLAHADVQGKLAETIQRLQNRDAEIAVSKANLSQLEDLAKRNKADRQSFDQQLAQLTAECKQFRQAHSDSKMVAERSQHEMEQIRAQLISVQQEKYVLESKIGQLNDLLDEKVQLLQEVDEHKRVNQLLQETNRELEGLLQKSKAYCDELFRESEDKVSRTQEFARHVEQEARGEIDRIVNENNELRVELEQLAQTHFEETAVHDELRVKLAELQAENNVLSARAHRLTQQLSQYTELPEDELAAAAQGQTPDLWELLSSGMEQLKTDLELASKYAASIDAGSVDGGVGDELFSAAN